jgi:ABC-2 type transport system ATP-binding protein
VLRLRLASGVLPPEIAARAQLDPTGRHMVPIEDYSQIADVLIALRSAGAKIADMEVAEPDLEDVFLKIMRREESAASAPASP